MFRPDVSAAVYKSRVNAPSLASDTCSQDWLMISEFSAALRCSPSDMAEREGLGSPLLLTGIVFVVAILLRQVVPLNTVVSWLLVVCERMLDGQHLYRDITEINPP